MAMFKIFFGQMAYLIKTRMLLVHIRWDAAKACQCFQHCTI